MSKLFCGIEFFENYVLLWAKASPLDPDIPEVLHRVVKTARFGRNSEKNGDISKSAFRLLHKKYPKNKWTAKTPYWYS